MAPLSTPLQETLTTASRPGRCWPSPAGSSWDWIDIAGLTAGSDCCLIDDVPPRLFTEPQAEGVAELSFNGRYIGTIVQRYMYRSSKVRGYLGATLRDDQRASQAFRTGEETRFEYDVIPGRVMLPARPFDSIIVHEQENAAGGELLGFGDILDDDVTGVEVVVPIQDVKLQLLGEEALISTAGPLASPEYPRNMCLCF